MMKSFRVLALVAFSGVYACGGGGQKTPDAGLSPLVDGAPVVDVSVGDTASDVATVPDVPTTTDQGVDTPPVDLGPSLNSIGGGCDDGADCDSGFCYSYPIGGYCSLLCQVEGDCPEGSRCLVAPGTGMNICYKDCAQESDCEGLQHCKLSISACLPNCQPQDCLPGESCNSQSGLCESTACVPTTESCNQEDDDCDGLIDEGCGPTVSAPEEVLVIDLGLVPMGAGLSSPTLEFNIPSGTGSFAILALADDQEFVGLWSFLDPDFTALHNPLSPFDSINRSFASEGALTVLVPNAPALYSVNPGTYRIELVKEGAYAYVPVYVLAKEAEEEETSLILDVNLHFVGTPNLNAENYLQKAKFVQVLETFWTVLDQANIQPGIVSAYNITGADADKFTFLDKTISGAGELTEMLTLSGMHPDSKALNFFFVQDITGLDTYHTLGIAGGVPGPPLFQGTASSGVAVSLSAYYAYTGDNADYGIAITAGTMSHEAGHYLGLFHVTEQSGDYHDALTDTPECFDTNDDGVADESECEDIGTENLMFWSAVGYMYLSDEQTTVLRSNPQVHRP
jgi:hypothetical protein